MTSTNVPAAPLTLLVCTVGGSPEPIVTAIKHWQPARVWFVPTLETRREVEERILPLAAREEVRLAPGCYDLCVLPNGQDFASCIDTLRRLHREVAAWLTRGEYYQVVVDFTGGTKCMSAALAVQAHRWRCQFAYVGGDERTRDGVGIVVSGKERVVHAQNPWEALGFQAIDDAITLFDEGAFAAASHLLDRAIRGLSSDPRKRQLNSLKLLAEGYDAWDRFDHRSAADLLGRWSKSANDFAALLDDGTRTDDLLSIVCGQLTHLRSLDASRGPSWPLVKDLLANARRRSLEGRFDDAVARLYRAVEAIAQTRLSEKHEFQDTSKLPWERVPDPLRSEWAPYAVDRLLKIGLQDAYRLLRALADPVGIRFHELGLDDRERSPLASRNASILAHGYQPVSTKVDAVLWNASLALADLTEDDLPRFVRLGR